jgi:hypothetical protein
MVARLFLAITKDNEIARQQRERFIVLKEMTGSLSVVFAAAALMVLKRPIILFFESRLIDPNWLRTLLVFGTFAFLCVFTACRNRHHVNQQRVWENEYTQQEANDKASMVTLERTSRFQPCAD